MLQLSRPILSLTFYATLGLAALAGSVAPGPAASAPAGLFEDPPLDPAHPASGGGVTFRSHGAQINAQLYQPAGEGPHPTVILLHGMPGNEQNLDLARAIQRAGWTVITFHYRGSWGSGGRFGLEVGLQDVDALLDRLQSPAAARAWGVDADRIVIMGHSYGGYVAAAAVAAHPKVLGVGLIAPWDPSYDARSWRRMTPAAARKEALEGLDDTNGRLGPVGAREIMRQILARGDRMQLARFGSELAGRPTLVVTATRDDPNDKALDLLPALKPAAKALTVINFDTDHSFNDRRIALARTVLLWLEGLPGAPVARATPPAVADSRP